MCGRFVGNSYAARHAQQQVLQNLLGVSTEYAAKAFSEIDEGAIDC